MVTSTVQLNSIFLLPSTLSAGYHSLVGGFFYGRGGLQGQLRLVDKWTIAPVKQVLIWKSQSTETSDDSCPRPPIFRFLRVMVNFLSALAMVLKPKKVRVKRVNDRRLRYEKETINKFETGTKI